MNFQTRLPASVQAAAIFRDKHKQYSAPLKELAPQELNESIYRFRSGLRGYIISHDLLVQDGVCHWKHFTPGIYQGCKERLRAR